MAFYQDPDKPRHRPSLIEDLFRLPTKPGLHPLENQATATLAWLIDRSPVFAREFIELFLGHGSAPDGTLGARTWVNLPNPDGGPLFPDLCIEAADGQLQLLVEVKVAAGLAQKLCGDGIVRSQEVHYRWAWRHLGGPKAAIRAVGTLRREPGSTALLPDDLQAHDVTWSQVRDLIHRLIERPTFSPETAVVAASFLRALRARIAVDPPNPQQLAQWRAERAALITEIATDLRNRASGATLSGLSMTGCVGHRVHVPEVLGSELRLRVYGSLAGAPQNIFGEPDSLIVGVERDARGTLEARTADIFADAGFGRETHVVGDVMHCRAWAIEEAAAEPAVIAAKIWDSLSSTQVGPWARRAAAPLVAASRHEGPASIANSEVG